MKIVSFLKKIRFYSSLLIDRKTPWTARLLLAIGILYLLFPQDLISDFIPVFGYVDDITVGMALIALSLKLIPEELIKRKSKNVK